MKRIKWNGNGIRKIHGYSFIKGQEIDVEDDNIADDILTQPGEPFEEIEVEKPVVVEIKMPLVVEPVEEIIPEKKVRKPRTKKEE